MKTIYKEKIIPHIKEDMYNLVANVSSYPDFVPYCSETEILEDDGAQVLASVSLNFHGLAKKFTT
ncbi:MAG: SRPBCC family protein, partial [Pseudomonadota bacterium]|nr:SRPBCC family protein [Pseudomonadota bacterium]